MHKGQRTCIIKFWPAENIKLLYYSQEITEGKGEKSQKQPHPCPVRPCNHQIIIISSFRIINQIFNNHINKLNIT